MQHAENIQYVYLLNKYLKCSVWRLALRYDIYIYISLGFKRLRWPMCGADHLVTLLYRLCRNSGSPNLLEAWSLSRPVERYFTSRQKLRVSRDRTRWPKGFRVD